MERETLEQVIAYLEERRLESLNFEAIETTEADPVMLDLAKMVVEEKIRDLEPKQSINIKEIIISGKALEIAKDIIDQVDKELGTEQEEKAICLGLCELKIPQQLTEELEKVEKLKNNINAKKDDMTVREEKIKSLLLAILKTGESIASLIDRHNEILGNIKKIANRKNESNAQKN